MLGGCTDYGTTKFEFHHSMDSKKGNKEAHDVSEVEVADMLEVELRVEKEEVENDETNVTVSEMNRVEGTGPTTVRENPKI